MEMSNQNDDKKLLETLRDISKRLGELEILESDITQATDISKIKELVDAKIKEKEADE